MNATSRSKDSRSRVSAVMLTCGQWEYTRRCVESLQDDLDAGMELVIVDNASIDGTPERLRSLLESRRRLRIVESPINLGFAAGSNLGTTLTGGDLLLYINNDVVVPRGWLGRLVAHLDASPETGLVGPRSNSIAGQQLLKPVPYDTESLDNYEPFASRLAGERAGSATEVGRIIGFCMLVRRQVVNRIGGFDPGFEVGNFEDDDFCLRARLAGFRIAQAEDVFVHHFGGRTFAGLGLDRNASVLENWEIFKRKWNLPANRSIRQFYSDADIARIRFDPARHRISLESYRPDPLPIEEMRGFNFLLVPEPADRSWERAIRSYLSTFDAGDDVALLVRAEPPEATGSVLARMAELAAEAGIEDETCPEIVGVDAPLDPRGEARLFSSAGAFLSCGTPLSPPLRRYAALAGCPVLEETSPWALRATAVLGRSRSMS
jgi:GT2 family glycosyltransferase